MEERFFPSLMLNPSGYWFYRIMNKAPFHRRIIPIIFTIVFFAVAPALLFYAAGYRWNPKKGQVERNGTVIFDTQPTGASITIDGRNISQKTPITIQDMTPGLHSFGLSKNGYHDWTKSLDVYPEKVTFVDDVWLWKNATSTLLYPTDASILSMSPDGAKLFLASASPTRGTIFDLASSNATDLTFKDGYIPAEKLEWSENSRFLLSGTFKTDKQNWIIDSFVTHQPMLLMSADYRWSGTDLVGNDGQTQTFLRTSDYGLSRNPLAKDQVDAMATAEIRHASGTSDLVYVSLDQPDRGLVLPQGNWKIESVLKDHAVLNDGNRWLSLEFTKDKPEYHTADGDRLRSITVKKQITTLLVNGSELWIWNHLAEPELIQRQSENIVDAAWHREGSNVFFATDKGIFALGLDARDRRLITQLDSFDDIKGLSFESKRLLILGRKGSESGVWSLDIE